MPEDIKESKSCIYENCTHQPVTSKQFRDKNGRDYCIFHARNENKTDEFYNRIKNIIKKNTETIKMAIIALEDEKLTEKDKEEKTHQIRQDNPMDFSGYYFPGDAEFNLAIFSGEADFSEATFSGNAYFAETTFSAEANFTNTTFSGEARFTSATFSREVYFSDTTFSGEAYFSDTTFSGEAYFSDVAFTGEAYFRKAKFIRAADFRNIKFNRKAYLSGATFIGEANFTNTAFIGKSSFSEAIFNGIAYFSGAKFAGNAIFISTAFSGEARFRDVTFSGKAEFMHSTFSGMTSFRWTTFSGETKFDGVTFNVEADFYNTTFSGVTKFMRATFSGEADFSNATFIGEASFNLASFHKKAWLNVVKFKEEVNFRFVNFMSEVTFHSTRFQNESYFTDTFFGSDTYFRDCLMENVIFINANLNTLSFLRSEISKTRFSNCFFIPLRGISSYKSSKNKYDDEKFGQSEVRQLKDRLKVIKEWKDKILELVDEKEYRNGNKNIAPSDIRDVYMQLKYNRDEARDFDLANEFYAGEMRMKREVARQEVKERKNKITGFFNRLLFKFLHVHLLLPLLTLASLLILHFTGDELYGWISVGFFSATFLLYLATGFFRYLFYKIYEHSSGFGNKPMRSFVVFIIVLLLSSAVMIGFEGVKEFDSPLKPPTELKISNILEFMEHHLYVSIWNIKAGFKDSEHCYTAASPIFYLLIFLVQYVFRPFMIALIGISIRRKVKRG